MITHCWNPLMWAVALEYGLTRIFLLVPEAGKIATYVIRYLSKNDLIIGDRVIVKSGVHIWNGVRIEDGVFIGPNVALTNDRFPPSKNYPDNFLRTIIKKGASICANATLLPGIVIGENAMVGAGSVMTKDVIDNAAVLRYDDAYENTTLRL